MESSTARIALAVDDRRVDVVVPARRPVGEYLAQLVVLSAPTACGAAGWRLLRIGGHVVDAERSLDEAGVVDGEVLLLAPALPAPTGLAERADDLRAVITEHRGQPRRTSSAATTHAAHAIAVSAVLVATAQLAVAGTDGALLAAAVAVAMLVVAAALGRRPSRTTAASIWAFATLGPAALAAAGLGPSTADGQWWAGAAAVALAAAAGAVVVPSRAAVLGPVAGGALTVAASVAVLAAADPIARAAAPLVVGGLAIVEVTPRVGFLLLRPVDPARLARRGSRSRRAIVAGHVVGATAVAAAAVALALGDDAWGWWLIGLAAAVLALHAVRYERVAEVVPLAAGALGAATALGLGVVGPRSGPTLAAAGIGASGLMLAAALAAAPTLRPLARRRLTRLELVLAIPTTAVAVAASGAFDALVAAGRHLG